MTQPTDAKPVLRTVDATTNRVRRLIAENSARLGGERITQDRMIAAMARLAEDRPDELLSILQSPTPTSGGTNATD